MNLSDHYRGIIECIGENVERDAIKETPERAAKAMEFLMQGYKQNLNDIVHGAIFESEMDEMVIVKDIELYSTCEHHMLPFIGKCHIAYVPQGRIIGLSKCARIADHFARRMQVQERLTKEIADSIMKITNAAGVGVVIEAQHLCMMMRGVEKQNSVMVTSMMLGTLKHNAGVRAEFLGLISK